jgi:hypothetical protein
MHVWLPPDRGTCGAVSVRACGASHWLGGGRWHENLGSRGPHGCMATTRGADVSLSTQLHKVCVHRSAKQGGS